MKRDTRQYLADVRTTAKVLSPLIIITVCVLLFIAGCGSDANSASNDGSTVYDVGLTTLTVPTQGGDDVECVVAQYREVAISCNWDSVNNAQLAP